MTSEGKSVTEKWVVEYKAVYPYAYDKGDKLFRALGMRGRPSAVLVNPEGEIVWRNHPAKLTKAVIEAHIQGALKVPLSAWPRSASSARKALAKRQYARALALAEKIKDAAERELVTEAVQGLLARSTAALETDLELGNYLGAQERAETLDKQLAGLPEHNRIQEILEQLDNDADIRVLIKAQVAVEKLLAKEIKTRRQLERLVDALNGIREEHPESYLAGEIEVRIEQLRERRSGLR